jgi:hypothetical protein
MPLPFSSVTLAGQASVRSAHITEAVNQLNELQIIISRLHNKVQPLKHKRSDDPVQQAQTEAIIEMFNAVAWIQRILWPTVEQLMLPGNVGAARDAAAAAAGGGSGGGAAAQASMLKAGVVQSAAMKRI